MTPGSDSEYDPDDNADNNSNRGDQEAGPSSSSFAPYKSFPKATYASVEYPSTVSQPAALLRLVSQEDINEVFNAPLSEQKSLEIRYGNMERNGIPVRGARVPSQKLLLKITRRRRRRRPALGDEDGDDTGARGEGKERLREGAEEGIFTSEVVGAISQTVRFRAMTDFHYTPDPRGRVSGVLNFLKETDYDAILDYVVPPSEEVLLEESSPPPDAGPDWHPEIRSTLDLQPLPIFSERKLPLVYNFKNHSATAVEEYVDERTGEVKKRYINRMRFVTFALQKASHSQALGHVPKGPLKSLKDKTDKLDQDVLAKMRSILAERPVWQRRPFLLQLDERERQLVEAHRYYLPSVVYTFGAGPFWKTIVRFGYDPRTDPESWKWQRIFFYLNVNRPGPRSTALEGPDSDEEGDEGGKDEKKWEEQQQELVAQGKRPALDETQGYTFDGQNIHRSKPDYQLCDITDPLIRRYIDDPTNRTTSCDGREGWYTRPALDLIKAMTRGKFEYVKKMNEPAPDSLCYGMIEEFERGKSGRGGDFERDDSEELREIVPGELEDLQDIEMADN